MQQRPEQRSAQTPNEETGFVFVDTEKRVIQKWIKKTLAAMKNTPRYSSSSDACEPADQYANIQPI